MQKLHDIIKDQEDYVVGCTLARAIYHIPQKRSKFLSRINDERGNDLRVMQRGFMKSINEYFQQNQVEELDPEDLRDLQIGRMGQPSIEAAVVSPIKLGNGDIRDHLTQVGAQLKKAEEIYQNAVKNGGLDYKKEYQIILNHLKEL